MFKKVDIVSVTVEALKNAWLCFNLINFSDAWFPLTISKGLFRY